MAIINISPLYLKNATLKIGASNYEKHVSSVTFTPSSSTAVWKGLTPSSVHTRVTTATWTCDLDYAQDWETADSLSRYLFDHEGESIAATFEPEDGGIGFAATLTITPGAIGGAVDGFGTATVSLGVEGKPAIVPSA